jgi:hypothetical protein
MTVWLSLGFVCPAKLVGLFKDSVVVEVAQLAVYNTFVITLAFLHWPVKGADMRAYQGALRPSSDREQSVVYCESDDDDGDMPDDNVISDENERELHSL